MRRVFTIVGSLQFAVSSRLFAVGSWQLAVCSRRSKLNTARRQRPTFNCKLPTAYCPLSTPNYKLPTANCPLPTLFLLIAILLSGLTARSQITPAYQVKAAFLYNFSQFVEWPPSAYESGRAPFVIGILGDNPFGTYLEELVKDEKVGSRPIVIKKYKDVGDVKGCHILYINLPKAAEAVRSLNHRGILTVSDADDFAKEGGMVRFYTQNNKIRLQVNLTAVKSANIEVSSKLLRVSDIIE